MKKSVLGLVIFIFLLLSVKCLASVWYKDRHATNTWHSSLEAVCESHKASAQKASDDHFNTIPGANPQKRSVYTCGAVSEWEHSNGCCLTKYTLIEHQVRGTWIGTYEYTSQRLECAVNEKPDLLTGSCVKGQQNGGESCPAAGNPINPFVGNKFETRIDLVSSSDSEIPFFRYYNSAYPDTTQLLDHFGKNWRHSYNAKLTVRIDASSVWAELISHDGKSVFFSGTDASIWDSHPVYAISAEFDTGNNVVGWQITRGNTVTHFDTDGDPVAIYERTRDRTLDFIYDSNKVLKEVRYSNDVWLKFEYLRPYDKLITKVISSSGKEVEYTYDAANRLVAVDYSDNTQELYHFDSPYGGELLTGITNRNGHKYVEWEYDNSKRATASQYLTTSGTAVERFSLDYTYLEDATDPRVIQTNPLGKQTVYHWEKVNGVRRVKTIEGVPSANCLGANKSYTYYTDGKIQSKTDWKGTITSYQYDTQGRETLRTEAVGTSEEKQIATEWQASLGVPTKITEGNRVTEMTYDSNGRMLTFRKGKAAQSK